MVSPCRAGRLPAFGCAGGTDADHSLACALGVGEWSASVGEAVTAAFGQAGDQTAPRQGHTEHALGVMDVVRPSCGHCAAHANAS
jgi:hypothetical protein